MPDFLYFDLSLQVFDLKICGFKGAGQLFGIAEENLELGIERFVFIFEGFDFSLFHVAESALHWLDYNLNDTVLEDECLKDYNNEIV